MEGLFGEVACSPCTKVFDRYQHTFHSIYLLHLLAFPYYPIHPASNASIPPSNTHLSQAKSPRPFQINTSHLIPQSYTRPEPPISPQKPLPLPNSARIPQTHRPTKKFNPNPNTIQAIANDSQIIIWHAVTIELLSKDTVFPRSPMQPANHDFEQENRKVTERVSNTEESGSRDGVREDGWM